MRDSMAQLVDLLVEIGGLPPGADPEMVARVCMEKTPTLRALSPDAAEEYFDELVFAIRARMQPEISED